MLISSRSFNICQEYGQLRRENVKKQNSHVKCFEIISLILILIITFQVNNLRKVDVNSIVQTFSHKMVELKFKL